MSLSTRSKLTTFSMLFLVIAVFAMISTARADFKFEIQTAGSYYDNVFNNSMATEDSKIASKITVDFYPFSFLKLQGSRNFSYYGNTQGLRNFVDGFDISIVPLKDNSAFSIWVNANYQSTSYVKETVFSLDSTGVALFTETSFEGFENKVLNANISLGLLASDQVHFRGGFEYTSTNYTNEKDTNFVDGRPVFNISGDHTKYGFFIGSNFTLPFDNTFDIEFGYASLGLTYANPPEDSLYYGPVVGWVTRDNLRPSKDTLRDGDIGAFYVSPRWSRPLGNRIGISAIYTFREFQDIEDKITPGTATTFLSPWASVYDGHTVTLSARMFLIPNFIISTGYGYWDKSFITSEKERGISGQPPYVIFQRQDQMSRIYISFKRPFPSKTDLYIEPVLQLDYTENESTDDFYDYSAFSITGGLTVRF